MKKEHPCVVCGSPATRSETCGKPACGYELRQQRNRVRIATTEQATDQRYQNFIADVASRPIPPTPSWAAPTTSGRKLVVPTAFFSDAHFDEIVDPAQINGVNAYNREIAEQRLQKFASSTVKLAKHYFSGLNYPGICLPLGGDILSGNIHEELRESNAGTLAEGIVYWVPRVAAAVALLADEFGKVYLPCVVGNHGRNTRKPIHKSRVRDNFDWLFYQLLAREFRNDKRITFAISDASDFSFSLFGTRYSLTHGDQFRGGSGIAGALSPLMIGDHRKRKRQQAIRRPYDYLICGHWHQLTHAKGFVINGALKGYDEFAFDCNFDYEPPQQGFWLTSRERTQIWGFTPIHCTEVADPYSGVSEAAGVVSIAFPKAA